MSYFDVYYFWNVFVPWCLAKRDVAVRKLRGDRHERARLSGLNPRTGVYEKGGLAARGGPTDVARRDASR